MHATRFASVIAIAFLGVASRTFAGTVHVPADYPTIQSALDAAQDGDDVSVAAGTYFENIHFPAKSLRLHSTDGPSATIIDGSGGAGSLPVVWFSAGATNDSIIEGFKITGGDFPYGGGIYCELGAQPSLIGNWIIHNCAQDGGGIYPRPENTVVILRNLIGWNSAVGQAGGLQAPADGSDVRNNLFIGNQASDGGAYFSRAESTVTLVNNTFYGNTSPNGAVAAGDGGLSLVNCILWGNGVRPLALFDVTAQYSTIEGGAGQPWFGSGCLDVDPHFVDASNQDLHLQATSPARDAGNPDPSYNDPDGSRNDQGYTGGPTTAPTIPRWMPVAPLPEPRRNMATVTCGSRIYTIGGSTPSDEQTDLVLVFDPATNLWTDLSSYPGPPIRNSMAVCLDGYIYILGGYVGNFEATDLVWRFDPCSVVWKSCAPMPEPRLHASAVVVSGRIYVIGGRSQPTWTYHDTVFAYDPTFDTPSRSSAAWTRLTDAPVSTPLGDNSAVTLDGQIFTIGSYEPEVTSRSLRYNPAADRIPGLAVPWHELPPTPLHGALAGATIRFRNELWFLGGVSAATPYGVADVWRFRPMSRIQSTQSGFSLGPPMPEPLAGHGVAVVDGQLFVIGGSTTEGVPTDRCWVLRD